MTIVFSRPFTSHPLSTNRVASQSSNSGCTGQSPCDPKSSTVLTRPTPKSACQNRFTVTRDVSGLDGSTSHRASPRRLLGNCFGIAGSTAGTPGLTRSPGAS